MMMMMMMNDIDNGMTDPSYMGYIYVKGLYDNPTYIKWSIQLPINTV